MGEVYRKEGGQVKMNTLDILKELCGSGKINQQAYKTYRGQVMHGDEAACIIGLQRKRLINDKGEIIDGKNIITRTS